MTAPSDSLGKDARALLRAARGGDDVPAEERRRLLETFARQRSGLIAPLGEPVEPAPARAGRTVALSGWRSRRAAPRLGWAVAALVLTGSLAALAQHQGVFQRLGAWLEEAGPAAPQPQPSRRAPRSVVLPRPALSLAEPAATEPVTVPAVTEPAASEPAVAVPRAREQVASEPGASNERRQLPAARSPARPPPASVVALDPREVELIAAARTALAERRHDAARRHAERHAAQFPRGAFSEEREAILALSDCRGQLGNQRGQRFVRERPGSVLAERVRRDCELSSNPVPQPSEPGTH
ncbi:MAG: hypothetical protein RL685_3558 [Pseudomonadota bacterium]|jgi:hypothetical protein